MSQTLKLPRKNTMKISMMIVPAAALAFASVTAVAGPRGSSSSSPGHQMQSQTAPSSNGASELTPADQKKDAGAKSASDFTPSDTKKDKKKK
jgi:hypothetical protein